MSFSKEETEAYYRKKKQVNGIVLQTVAKNKSVVYGGHALNAHLNTFLERPTQDYDIYAQRPKANAAVLERNLDKKFGGNYFFVKPAQHKGTYKVVSRVTEETVADFTKRPHNLPKKGLSLEGRRVAVVTLPFIKQGIRRTLKDKESAYRHGKDRDALRRILVQEELDRRRKAIRREPSKSFFSLPKLNRSLLRR